MDQVPLLIVNGTIGSGKTTILGELSEILGNRDMSHTAVDLDALTQTRPAPSDDPFNLRLGCTNLAAVWESGRAQGATRLIVAGVVESQPDLDVITAAIPGSVPFVCRLTAPLDELQRRVERRELGSGRAWHVARAVELSEILSASSLDDVVIQTGGRSVRDIGLEVLHAVGW